MPVFEYTSYKKFVRDQIEEMKRPGLMAELANDAGCDRTYIAQVLSGKAHLTPDHAIGLAEAFSMNDAEAEFFLLLVLKERSNQEKAKRKLEARLDRIRLDQMAVTKQIRKNERTENLPEALKLRYYSSWKFAAVHILVSIKTFQNVSKIAEELRISIDDARSIAETLVEMGLVQKTGDRYGHKGFNIHIPAESPLTSVNHLNWRMQAMAQVDQREAIHYTDIFSISADDEPALRSMILSFVDRYRKKVSSSGSEIALALTIDVFRIGTAM